MITKAWFPLRPHAEQKRLWTSQARFKAVACGRGSGKTELARRYVVRWLPVRKPGWGNPLYFYALPTYNQAKRVAWEPLKALVPPHWIDKISESELTIRTITGSTLYLVGLDVPARIEGVQWDGGIIDESCDQPPRSFDLSVRPALSHRNAWCWRIGVPKRTGRGVASFKEACFSGEWEYYNWPSSDILSEEEIAAAKRQLSLKDFNEQYQASWETTSGAIFHAFDSVFNVNPMIGYHPELPLIIGSDFNVDPMAWVIGQVIGNELHVFDELFIRNTYTQATLDALFAKYGHHKSGFVFIGDATARSRNTRASNSDYLQILQDARFVNSKVLYPRANPPRADRFAACNALLHNAQGQRRAFIHPRCENLIRDIGQRSYKPFTADPDDEEDVGHITDAWGYIIHYLFPITTTPPGAIQIETFNAS